MWPFSQNRRIVQPMQNEDEIAALRAQVYALIEDLTPPQQLAALADTMAIVLAASGVHPGAPAFDGFMTLLNDTLPKRTRATVRELEEAGLLEGA